VTTTVKPTQTIGAQKASIPSNYSRLIARELELQIRDLASLLRLTQLTTEQFLQDELLLTPQQQIQILQNALKLSTSDTVSLRLGRRLTPSTHGAMGFLANSSSNLFMALKAVRAFLPTRMSFARVELVTKQDHLECYCYFDLEISSDIRRSLSEAVAMAFFELAKFIVGQSLDELTTSFSHAEPSYSAHYSDYLPGKFEFSAQHTMVKIPLHLCQVPNVSANHENYLLALRQCKVMLKQLKPNEDTCKYQIQKMMLSHPPGVLNEEEAAATLFISKRTLARRLQQEGSSFREIRDEILSQQASGYLSDSRMSVEAIAALLNYHDSANFRRAFKRWFQITPDQYRQRQSAK